MSNDKLPSLPVIIGKKIGMTRIFDESGNHVPVTVIQLVPNVVSQVKTLEKDGYEAYQIGFCEKREKLLNEPTKGQLKKAGIDKHLSKFTEVLSKDVSSEFLGKQLSIEEFKPSTIVDVTGTSKGKGTQGVMKRFGFSGGPATHGSHFHRRPGSIGCRATPARVFKGKKLPGHQGVERTTIQNLVIVEVNQEKGFMLIKGSVPGAKNSYVRVSKAIKA